MMKSAMSLRDRADFFKMRTLRILILLLLAVLPVLRAGASTDSLTVRVNNAFMLEIGAAHRADTYLSPLHYDGWTVKPVYEHAHSFKGDCMFWRLKVALQLDRTLNPVRNSVMWGAQFVARWSAIHPWRIGATPLVLGIGPSSTIDAGALYMPRNGNNPVAANASWTVDAAGYAYYPFNIGKTRLNAMYTVDLPVIGAMFAPDYGQLYYEIYLGDRTGLANAAYWGRYFRLDQYITLDVKVNSKYIRLGYGCNILSTKVNNIVSRRIDHTFVIGITTDWLTHK